LRVLVGDVGGTNARFALIEAGERLEVLAEATLPSRRFPAFSDALLAFLEMEPEARSAERACFGLAGPVRRNRCETTNLPWVVEGREIARTLKLPEAPLLNDLEAAAWGLTVLDPNGVRSLHEGNPGVGGNRALLAAGTGLGEAVLVWDGECHHAFATEGGHGDFGPADELQVELWRYLMRQFGHVSWERVASGPGLVSIFRFLLQLEGKPEPEWFEAELREGDAAEAISRHAHDEGCRICGRTLGLFFQMLGAEAGNLALRTLATGGIYLAGGIVFKLLPELMASQFLSAFVAKGRFRSLVQEVPVKVVVDDRLALWGAVAAALRRGEPLMAPPALPCTTIHGETAAGS
jgi:glucokinase